MLHCSPTNTHIWLFWTQSINVPLLSITPQSISVSIYSNTYNAKSLCSCVYALCTKVGRRDLWAELLGLATSSTPWFIAGDFNVVTSSLEKAGRCPIDSLAVQEFNDFISSAGLIDAGYSGSIYTWCNNFKVAPKTWA